MYFLPQWPILKFVVVSIVAAMDIVSKNVCHASPERLSIFIPLFKITQSDSYLCTSTPVASFKESYIVSFRPVAEMSTIHHMLLYGCEAPGSEAKLWQCGQMGSSNELVENGLPTGDVCSDSRKRILYAWARNAPNLTLPEDVSFEIGGDSGIHSLVLQFHSGDHVAHNMKETLAQAKSLKDGTTHGLVGMELQVSSQRTKKLAGVYLLGTGGHIPPRSSINLESACLMRENKVIHPFAYRTHSHSLGILISGYKVEKNNRNGQCRWNLIGKKNPQLPQMFYPVDRAMTVKKGDILAARCKMRSDRTTVTYIGPSKNDEMCNFYLMYYVEDGKLLENNLCFPQGTYENFWSNEDLLGLNNIPTDDV